jgi:hypothetical protein
LEELDSDGDFLLPITLTRTLLNIPDDIVTVDTSSEATPGGQHTFHIVIRCSSGLRCDLSTSNPRLVARCDEDLAAATEKDTRTYSIAVMRTALRLAEGFLPNDESADCEARFHTIRVFDDVRGKPEWQSGDGHLFCSDGRRVFYFQSEDFEGKGLAIHARHRGPLVDFLSKCSAPTLEIRRGARMTYAASGEEHLVGWVHQTETHPRFMFYSLNREKYVLRVSKAKLLSALDILPADDDRVRFIYTHRNTETGGSTVQFVVSDAAGTVTTFPVKVFHKAEEPSLEENIEFFVEVRYLESLFADAVRDEVELRIAQVEKSERHPHGGAMLRTFEDITVDETDGRRFRCKVVRFMPSFVGAT